MKKRLIAFLLSLSVIILSGAQAASASFGPIATTGDIANVQTQLNNLSSELAAIKNTAASNFVFGANNTQPIAGTNYSLAGSGVSATAGSIVLTSFTITQTGVPITSSMLSTNFYITLEPGNTARQEIAACTGVMQNSNGTATLTGCSRGLLPFLPYTASSSYAFPHGGGTTLILSNPPQLYNELAAIGNIETITGAWTFSSSSLPRVTRDTTNAQVGASSTNLATVGYVNSTSFAGAPNGSITVKGIYQEATTSTIASGTVAGSTGADLTLTQRTASTSCAAYSVVETNASGTLNNCFTNGTNITPNSITSNSSTLNGTTTASGTIILNGSSILPDKFGGTGADGALTLTTGTAQSYNLNSAKTFVKNFTSITISGTSSVAFTNPSASGTIIIFKSQGSCTLTSATSTMIDLRGDGASTGVAGIGLIAGPSQPRAFTVFGNIVVSGGAQVNLYEPGFGVNEVGAIYGKSINVFTGAGGTSGSTSGATGGVGGGGGGGFYLECGGALTLTGAINANGSNGTNGSGSSGTNVSSQGGDGGGSNSDGLLGSHYVNSTSASGGGGGGGGAGSVVILYNSLITNSTTIMVVGGAGGTSTNNVNGGVGGNGFFYVGQNTEY